MDIFFGKICWGENSRNKAGKKLGECYRTQDTQRYRNLKVNDGIVHYTMCRERCVSQVTQRYGDLMTVI